MVSEPDARDPIVVGPDAVVVRSDDHLQEVWEALGNVFDPELAMDIVSLGLVYDVRDEDGTIVVEMTLTTPGCPVSDSLPATARFAVGQVVGERPVDVRVVWDPPWTPAMMREEAAAAFGFRR